MLLFVPGTLTSPYVMAILMHSETIFLYFLKILI